MRSVPLDVRAASGGAFDPVHRPRITQRIGVAAQRRIALIVAAAGYGKSTALRQYLDEVTSPVVRYDLQADNSSLLGFMRGLAAAVAAISPDARHTVSAAYESAQRSRTPSDDLAKWMYAHLGAFEGTIAVDDLHVAEEDPSVSRFLADLIARTRSNVRWILASRSYLDLPIGTWMAYGEMDLAVDESDLRFTPEEARAAAEAGGVGVTEDELRELLTLLEGWPTALSFALRSSTRSSDLREVQATTRELVYRYLSEQVYRSLTSSEREALAIAAMLPRFDAETLRLAGCDDAAATMESLRRRVSFISPDKECDGSYRCHDLFRQFVLYQIDLQGGDARRDACARAAYALESSGDVAGSLFLYAQARDSARILSLLDSHGFALLEEAHSDAVAAAVAVLDVQSRTQRAMPLALRALMEASAGRFERAVAQLRRAAERATGAEMRGQILLCAARITINGLGCDPSKILESVESDANVGADTRAEASSYLAVLLARAGQVDASEAAAARALHVADGSESPHVQARILQRTGVAAIEVGSLDFARSRLLTCIELCEHFGLATLASRAYAWLYAAMALSCESVGDLEQWADEAFVAASRSGDALDMQYALESQLDVAMRRGDARRIEDLTRKHASIRTSANRAHEALSARAWIHAWEGEFEEAFRLAGDSWQMSSMLVARAFGAAVSSVFAEACNRSNDAKKAISAACVIIDDRAAAQWCEMAKWAPILFCALAHGAGGRFTAAQRFLGRVQENDHAIAALRHAVAAAIIALRTKQLKSAELGFAVADLAGYGYEGYGRLIVAVCDWAEASTVKDDIGKLTASEADILSDLSAGMTPKETATESGRSIYTVRTHIQNAITKLGCRGHHEAIKLAQELGMVTRRPS